MAVFIYGLHCPLSGEIRYIGKSVNPQKRLRAHISCAIRGAADHHTSRWIRRLAASDLAPSLVILHEVGPDEKWQDVERKLIADAIHRGLRLTNSTAGGEGLDYLNEEDRNRYLANKAKAMAQYRDTKAGRKQIAAFVNFASSNPEIVARRNESIRKALRKEDVRRRTSEKSKQTAAMPSVKTAQSKAAKALWSDEEYRKHKLAHLKSDEFRAAQSARIAARWADPEAKARLKVSRWTEEARKAQADRIRARNQKAASQVGART